MQAAVFKGNGVLEVDEVEPPKIWRPDQVLIQVRAAGICGSDLHALRAPPGLEIPTGIVLGHEFYGTIVEAGADVRRYRAGDTVVVDPCVPCGECWECRHGMGYLCSEKRHYGQTCDGAFAQYVVVEASQLHRVPPRILTRTWRRRPNRLPVSCAALRCSTQNRPTISCSMGRARSA